MTKKNNDKFEKTNKRKKKRKKPNISARQLTLQAFPRSSYLKPSETNFAKWLIQKNVCFNPVNVRPNDCQRKWSPMLLKWIVYLKIPCKSFAHWLNFLQIEGFFQFVIQTRKTKEKNPSTVRTSNYQKKTCLRKRKTTNE